MNRALGGTLTRLNSQDSNNPLDTGFIQDSDNSDNHGLSNTAKDFQIADLLIEDEETDVTQ